MALPSPLRRTRSSRATAAASAVRAGPRGVAAVHVAAQRLRAASDCPASQRSAACATRRRPATPPSSPPGPHRAVARTSVRRSAAASAAGDARATPKRTTSSPPRSHNRPSRKIPGAAPPPPRAKRPPKPSATHAARGEALGLRCGRGSPAPAGASAAGACPNDALGSDPRRGSALSVATAVAIQGPRVPSTADATDRASR